MLKNYFNIFIIAYLDNILIYLENKKDYVTYIKIILDALQKAYLGIKLEKCKFYVTELEFLGYIINIKGFSISPKKIKTIRAWLTLTFIKDVWEFLGFCRFN